LKKCIVFVRPSERGGDGLSQTRRLSTQRAGQNECAEIRLYPLTCAQTGQITAVLSVNP
jgi:hypothetical protein